MSKTILCALDVSQPAHEAPVLKRAAQFAELDGARLDVMTVIPTFGSSLVAGYFGPDFHERVVEEAKTALENLCIETLGAEANGKLRHVVATGKVYEEILRAAKADRSDLIVIGSHTPELSDYLIGPNAARIVRHAQCSVHVVR